VSSLHLCNASFCTWKVHLIFSIILQHTTSKLSEFFWSIIRSVQIILGFIIVIIYLENHCSPTRTWKIYTSRNWRKSNVRAKLLLNTPWGYRGKEVYLQSFAVLTLDECESSVSRPGRFTPKERPPLHLLNRRLGGPHNLPACCEEKEHLLPLPEMGKNWYFFRICMKNYIELFGGTNNVIVNECSHV
jgi:hypothetical protein